MLIGWWMISFMFQKKHIIQTQEKLKQDIENIRSVQITMIQNEVIQLREHTHSDFKKVTNQFSEVREKIVRSVDEAEQQFKMIVENSENVIRLEVSSLEKQLSNQVFELEKMNQELDFKNRQLEYADALDRIENLENPKVRNRGYGLDM